MITILSVGKRHEYANAIDAYEKRLKAPWNTKWVLIPNSSKNGPEAQKMESGAILDAVDTRDYVLLLDERGDNLTSPEFSGVLERAFAEGKSAVIVIGGAYGVSDELRARANKTVALGKMVYPHQLVRLILAEQIYRAQAIASGHPYHHE
jgi:23S rRNA (pseudouridine1915-N3)-methyltransferase